MDFQQKFLQKLYLTDENRFYFDRDRIEEDDFLENGSLFDRDLEKFRQLISGNYSRKRRRRTNKRKCEQIDELNICFLLSSEKDDDSKLGRTSSSKGNPSDTATKRLKKKKLHQKTCCLPKTRSTVTCKPIESLPIPVIVSNNLRDNNSSPANSPLSSEDCNKYFSNPIGNSSSELQAKPLPSAETSRLTQTMSLESIEATIARLDSVFYCNAHDLSSSPKTFTPSIVTEDKRQSSKRFGSATDYLQSKASSMSSSLPDSDYQSNLDHPTQPTYKPKAPSMFPTWPEKDCHSNAINVAKAINKSTQSRRRTQKRSKVKRMLQAKLNLVAIDLQKVAQDKQPSKTTNGKGNNQKFTTYGDYCRDKQKQEVSNVVLIAPTNQPLTMESTVPPPEPHDWKSENLEKIRERRRRLEEIAFKKQPLGPSSRATSTAAKTVIGQLKTTSTRQEIKSVNELSDIKKEQSSNATVVKTTKRTLKQDNLSATTKQEAPRTRNRRKKVVSEGEIEWTYDETFVKVEPSLEDTATDTICFEDTSVPRIISASKSVSELPELTLLDTEKGDVKQDEESMSFSNLITGDPKKEPESPSSIEPVSTSMTCSVQTLTTNVISSASGVKLELIFPEPDCQITSVSLPIVASDDFVSSTDSISSQNDAELCSTSFETISEDLIKKESSELTLDTPTEDVPADLTKKQEDSELLATVSNSSLVRAVSDSFNPPRNDEVQNLPRSQTHLNLQCGKTNSDTVLETCIKPQDFEPLTPPMTPVNAFSDLDPHTLRSYRGINGTFISPNETEVQAKQIDKECLKMISECVPSFAQRTTEIIAEKVSGSIPIVTAAIEMDIAAIIATHDLVGDSSEEMELLIKIFMKYGYLMRVDPVFKLVAALHRQALRRLTAPSLEKLMLLKLSEIENELSARRQENS